jgi:hypothetical protein
VEQHAAKRIEFATRFNYPQRALTRIPGWSDNAGHLPHSNSDSKFRKAPVFMAKPQARVKIYGTPKKPSLWRSPLVWIALVVIVAVFSLFMTGEREAPVETATGDAPLPAAEQQLPPVDTGNEATEPSTANASNAATADRELVTEDTPPVATQDNGDPDPAVTPEVAAESKATKPGDEARATIADVRRQGGIKDFGALFAKAGELSKAGRMADAYLLYFYAAREGHAESAYVLGGWSDPNHFSRIENVFDDPNPLQALKWYRIAASDGNKDAQNRLRELQKWVEARARTGDIQAQQLLLSFR